VVDGGGLENRCTRKGIGGSNPSPSANSQLLFRADFALRLNPLRASHGLLAFQVTRAGSREWPRAAWPFRWGLNYVSGACRG
jgi:hypothetical protein